MMIPSDQMTERMFMHELANAVMILESKIRTAESVCPKVVESFEQLKSIVIARQAYKRNEDR